MQTEEQLAIRTSGNILESDYVNAQHLHSRALRVVGIILLVFSVFVGVLNFMSWVNGFRSASDVIMFPLFATLFLSYIFVLRPWLFRRAYRKHPALHEPSNIAMGEGGLAYSSELGEGEIPWRLLIKWREGKRLFLIYQAPNLFHIVPKRSLQGDCEEDLRTLLTNKLGRAA